jgi:3-hydroxyacyl-CoA dehydrogenase/3a,7a,12a-trihydroxy-5b-cholest-24-enoyl-CoA hydratase
MMQNGRIALVTGAGKGLGAAFAEALAADGCRVIVNNRTHLNTPSSAQTVVDRIQANNGVAAADHADVGASGSAEAMIKNAVNTFGGLDTLVLNAGVTGPAVKVGAGEDTKLRGVMEINFFANTALIEAALPQLCRSDAGRILLIASSAGLYGVRGRAAYAASKGALIAYGLTLADELRRDGIGVNILAPYAATAMTTQDGREVDPDLLPCNTTAAAVWLTRPDCERTGEIWMAGANYFARAANHEGQGGYIANATADAFGGQADALSVIEPGTGFIGAEPAFAHFFKKAKTASTANGEHNHGKT